MSQKTHNATLQRGNLYVYDGVRYSNGVPVAIDEETKEYLEENAVDMVATGDGDQIERQKFTFEEIEEDSGDDAPATKAQPRARKRS